MKYIFILCLNLSSSFISAQQSLDALLQQYNSQNIPYITAEELKILQRNTDFLLVDTRESEEFEVSKIEGAVFGGYQDFSITQFVNFVTDKNRPIIVYCSLGIRSEDIGEKLKKAGYTNVKNLYGGIFEWKNKDFTVVNAEGKETEKVHAYSKQWSKWLLKGEKIY